jgi:hypothetical protein
MSAIVESMLINLKEKQTSIKVFNIEILTSKLTSKELCNTFPIRVKEKCEKYRKNSKGMNASSRRKNIRKMLIKSCRTR